MNQAGRWLRGFLIACLLVTLAVALLSAHPQSGVAPTSIAGAPAKPVIYGYDGTPQSASTRSLLERASVDNSARSATRPSAAVGFTPASVRSVVAAEAEPVVVSLGGEGEVAGAINQQPPNAVSSQWGASRTEVAGKSLAELQAMRDPYVVAENTNLPSASGSVDRVITNSVPIDVTTPMGAGIQSSEIWRILSPGGERLHNGSVVPWPS